MNKAAKKKLNVLAKEFGVSPADVIALIADKTGVEKKATNLLNEAELNLVTSHYMMTGQIADALMECLNPKGAIVFVEAEHMCMTMRGIKKPGSKTVTYAARGVFEQDQALCDRFFQLTK